MGVPSRPYRFVADDCDWPFIVESSKEAFLAMADLTGVEYIRYDKAATDAVPQNTFAALYDDVNDPQYDAPVIVPAVHGEGVSAEDIKKHAFQVKPDKTMLLNLHILDDLSITVHNNDRFRFGGVGGKLYEVRDVESSKSMGNRLSNEQYFLYSVS